MQKPQEKLMENLNKIPNIPGVYLFMNKDKKILYIGKATSLKSRVKSYFTKDIEEKRSLIIVKMVSEIKDIKFQKTDSVLEALLLESELIKKHQPKYNTIAKDQKSFNFIVITNEKFPKVLTVRERNLKIENFKFKISETFGPFPNSTELKIALKIIRKIFPFRDKCQAIEPHPSLCVALPLTGEEKQKQGCFNYQINLCPGICISAITEKEYSKTINHIKIFFRGQKKKLIKNLRKEMQELAKKREFEKATLIKKQIFALEHIQDIALIKNPPGITNSRPTESFGQAKYRVEAYDIAHISGSNMVGVMTVIENGGIKKQDYRMFKIKGQNKADDTKALQEVLSRRFKHSEWQFPDLIVVDGGVAQLNIAKKILKKEKKKIRKDIKIVAVVKNEKHKAREILGIEKLKIKGLENQILLANSEAHRFALKFHRKLRDKIS